MCHQVLISYRLRSISSLESREYELRECIPHTRACFWNVILKQIFLRMDVIGSFMTRDVFVAAPSVLMSGLTESVTSVDESESCQREVVTNSSEWVDFPSWQLNLHGHLPDDWPTLSLRTDCRWTVNLLFVEVNRFGLGEPRDYCMQ